MIISLKFKQSLVKYEQIENNKNYEKLKIYNNNKRYSVFNQQAAFKFGIKQFLLLAYRNFIKGYGTKRL